MYRPVHDRSQQMLKRERNNALSSTTSETLGLASLEESCTSDDGQLDEQRLLEKLLLGLYHRVSTSVRFEKMK